MGGDFRGKKREKSKVRGYQIEGERGYRWGKGVEGGVRPKIEGVEDGLA